MKQSKRKWSSPRLLVIPAAAATAAAAIALTRQRNTSMKFERLGAAALETLLNAIDANDPVTGGHVRRVARYALVLADAMGADEHAAHTIERVALFHDIGKIHEALFDVIHDHRKLTPQERRAINTHAARGATVLGPLASFYPELPKGVLAHHERWDGTGYPSELAGKAIPVAARVVAIADTFDAITHTRRYRPGRSLEVGMTAIGEGRGTQFDPELVDLFMAPPIQDRIREEMRGAGSLEHKPATHRRSHGGKRDPAPDVRFRWRETSPADSGKNRVPRRT
ncbi:MAG: HD domain-containing protein [Gemmatimonadota bacterium]|nr:HD domain-containing protein [Gemmatimonadota bacterium]